MSYAKLRPRRGTKTEWELVNPILLEGEFAVETPDAGTGKGLSKFKIGDGTTKWNDLPYAFDAAAAEAIHGGTVSTYKDIWLRSATQAEWEQVNPVLGMGEIVYIVDREAIKIGNGSSNFNDLTWIGKPFSIDNLDFDFGDIDHPDPEIEDKDYDFGDLGMY